MTPRDVVAAAVTGLAAFLLCALVVLVAEWVAPETGDAVARSEHATTRGDAR